MAIALYSRLFCALLFLTLDTSLFAAGVRTNKRRNPHAGGGFLRLKSLRVDSSIMYRYATTTINVAMVNNAARKQMAVVPVWIPNEAYVTNVSITLNGTSHSGTFQERVGRRRMNSRRRDHVTTTFTDNQDAQYLQVSSPVQPNTKISYQITYEQMLTPENGSYHHVIHVGHGVNPQEVKLTVNIRESQRILYVASAFHGKNGVLKTDSDAIKIFRSSNKRAEVTCHLNGTSKPDDTQVGLPGKLVVQYTIKRKGLLGEMLVEGNSFIHFFSPVGLPTISRKVVFVLDTSVSMLGLKMTQAVQTVMDVLAGLRYGDKFNIVAFSNWLNHLKKDELLEVTEDTLQSARNFFKTLNPGGGTNINEALLKSVDLLGHDRMDGHVCAPTIFFLTDGPPTAGVTSPDQILANVKRANYAKVTIHTIGIGSGADSLFLLRLALQNGGQSLMVAESVEAGGIMSRFLAQFEEPILANVRFRYPEEGIDYNTLSKYDFNLLYDGDEATVVGKIKAGYNRRLSTNIYAGAAAGAVNIEQYFNRGAFPNRERGKIQRNWGYLKYRMEEEYILRAANSTLRSKLRDKATNLALECGFLTPLTSLVLKMPGSSRNTIYHKDQSAHFETVDDSSRKRPLTSRRQRQRKAQKGKKTSFVDNDPHFVVAVPGLHLPVCFDLSGSDGQVYQLLHDSTTGIVVNGMVMSVEGSKGKRQTYFSKIAILHPDVRLTVSTSTITVEGKTYSWNHTEDTAIEGALVSIRAGHNVTITLGEDVTFSVLRHRVHHTALDVFFLGFYLIEPKGLSTSTHGVIGQFLYSHGRITRIEPSIESLIPAHISLRKPSSGKSRVKARLRQRRNMVTKQHVACWHVGRTSHGLLDGTPSEYLVKRLSNSGACSARRHLLNSKRTSYRQRTWS